MEMRGLWDEGYHWVSLSGIQVIDKKYSAIRLFYAFFNARTESCSGFLLLLRTLRSIWDSFFHKSRLFGRTHCPLPIATLPPTSLP
jgi:hypothetical protein